jgi:hypothetical protein
VFENRVLRRIFGPKRYEVTEGWRKVHSEKLCDFSLHTGVKIEFLWLRQGDSLAAQRKG